MNEKPGDRVFAVLQGNAERIEFLGFGTYLGDHPRPGSENPSPEDLQIIEEVIRENDERDWEEFDEAMCRWAVKEGYLPAHQLRVRLQELREKHAAEQARPMEDRVADTHRRMSLNPKIALDNGDIVWGCECWWSSVDQYDAMIVQYPNAEVVPIRIAEAKARRQTIHPLEAVPQ